MTRRLKPEERRVWAKVAATVAPRPGRAAPDLDATPEETRATPVRPTTRHHAAPASRPQPVVAPAERSGEKRVRRGRVAIDGKLDLHGLTWTEARRELAGFLAQARRRGSHCVLVITGKGGGEGRGVLKRALPDWLGEPDLRALVSGYSEAHAKHGGGGAYYIFLKRADPVRR